ncbi:MAG: nitronate monooxygenase [Acidimicrobiales bacterium]|nr:nitronate monooxygenase [Acidimicrobiales bacterium]
MLTTRFTELVGCHVPLQQAGMGMVATPELAAAVADAGAVGMVALPLAPSDQVAAELAGLKSRTAGVVGINFLMPFLNLDCVEAAADQAKIVEFFYGTPERSLVELTHRGGALTAWQVGSELEACQAADAGCDFLIAQGTEAGGHVRGAMGLFTLLDRVLDVVDLPVVAAGGIGTSRMMAAALAAGADAVRVGTRFLAASEADVNPEYLDRLVAANPEETVLTDVFSVMWPDAPHRVLRSAVEASLAYPGDVVGEVLLGESRTAIPKYSALCPTRTTIGEIAAMALYAGESVGAVKREQPAAEIVRQLVEGAEALLGSRR